MCASVTKDYCLGLTLLDYDWKIIDFKHGKEKERWRSGGGEE